MRIMLTLCKIGMGTLALGALLLLAPATVWADGNTPASIHTVAAGPYVIDVKLYADPPYVDTSTAIAITPRDSTLKLQGKIQVAPGPGTDATPLNYSLSAANDASGTLNGQIRMPVQGAWELQVQLTGPKGAGTATIPIVVGTPGAMPSWLAWLIGSSPLVFIAFWIWHQHRYRTKLATA